MIGETNVPSSELQSLREELFRRILASEERRMRRTGGLATETEEIDSNETKPKSCQNDGLSII